jgi:glycosyltransferase involved in cell wall biosynthesis
MRHRAPATSFATPARREPPTFSVVIPCYQGASTIGDAVASVLSQTSPPAGVFVCDDGSTDDLEGALAPYAHAVTLLRQEHRGVAAARNLGLRHATGEFVAICDADDLYLPALLEELTALAVTRPDLDILCCDGQLELEGQPLGRGRPDPGTFVVDDQRIGILRENFIPGRSAFRRRRLLDAGGYDEALECAEDWDAWVRLILAGSRAGYVDAALARTRIRAGSLSASPRRLWSAQVVVLDKALRRDDLVEEERAVARSHLGALRRAIRLAELRDAVAEGRPGLRRDAFRLALSRGFRAPTRLKATVAALSPRTARRFLRPETGDHRVPGLPKLDAST